MNLFSFSRVGSLFFLALAVIGTTMIVGSSSNQVWADVFEGTEGPDRIIGDPGDDQIDSKGGNDVNIGDKRVVEGFGNDNIDSGEGDETNYGDTEDGEGFRNDNIVSGDGDDNNTGNGGDDNIIDGDGDDELTGSGGRDIFVCGDGEHAVKDHNEAEGDITAPDCENT